jgi:hypothetical protein
MALNHEGEDIFLSLSPSPSQEARVVHDYHLRCQVQNEMIYSRWLGAEAFL